jgi:2-polyprenyl-3-methyl-5-hydroxy-6-metoxy-1,4-benzoquinol methylase
MPWHWFRSGQGGRLRKGRKRATAVAPMIAERARLQPGSRVLDIGCAFGLILERLRQDHGCEVFGIEPSGVARDHAERKCGVTFLGQAAEDLPGLSGLDGSFDLVIMSNVLENIVAPRPILEACRRVLKPEGRLYVETPNFFYYDSMNPYHPYIFSKDTLVALLAQAGLDTVDALYKRAADQPVPDSHVDRPTRQRFVTIFARPGEVRDLCGQGVDVDALLDWQRRSLASVAA